MAHTVMVIGDGETTGTQTIMAMVVGIITLGVLIITTDTAVMADTVGIMDTALMVAMVGIMDTVDTVDTAITMVMVTRIIITDIVVIAERTIQITKMLTNAYKMELVLELEAWQIIQPEPRKFLLNRRIDTP